MAKQTQQQEELELFDLQMGSKTHWELKESFQTSKPGPRDTPHLTKPHILILPNFPISSTTWEPSIQTYKPVGAILIQTTTSIYTPPSQLNVFPHTCFICFFFKYDSSLSPVSVDHKCLVWGQLLGRGAAYWWLLLKDKQVSLSSWQVPLAWIRPCASFPHPSWNFGSQF